MKLSIPYHDFRSLYTEGTDSKMLFYWKPLSSWAKEVQEFKTELDVFSAACIKHTRSLFNLLPFQNYFLALGLIFSLFWISVFFKNILFMSLIAGSFYISLSLFPFICASHNRLREALIQSYKNAPPYIEYATEDFDLLNTILQTHSPEENLDPSTEEASASFYKNNLKKLGSLKEDLKKEIDKSFSSRGLSYCESLCSLINKQIDFHISNLKELAKKDFINHRLHHLLEEPSICLDWSEFFKRYATYQQWSEDYINYYELGSITQTLEKQSYPFQYLCCQKGPKATINLTTGNETKNVLFSTLNSYEKLEYWGVFETFFKAEISAEYYIAEDVRSYFIGSSCSKEIPYWTQEMIRAFSEKEEPPIPIPKGHIDNFLTHSCS